MEKSVPFRESNIDSPVHSRVLIILMETA